MPPCNTFLAVPPFPPCHTRLLPPLQVPLHEFRVVDDGSKETVEISVSLPGVCCVCVWGGVEGRGAG
jgi:hypothetical protein